MLPILHLNGYKIANPTVLARIPESELARCSEATGTSRIFVSGSTGPADRAPAMAAAFDAALDEIPGIQADARAGETGATARWPVIVLRSPKGWTGPERSTESRPKGRSVRTRFRWECLQS